MPELQFPNPVDQQTYEAAGLVWTWNDSLKCWSSDPVSLPEQGAPVIVSSGEPAVRPDGTALKNGDLWFKTSGASPQLYVYQTSNSSWVVATPPTAAPGTVEQANKVRVSGSASGGTRPIATFGDSSSVSGGSYTDIKYPASPPTVTNGGKITAPGGFQGNVEGKATTAGKITRNGVNASSTASYRVMLGPNSNTPGDNGTCYVVQDANRLYYQPSTDKLICGTFQGNLTGNATTASTATNCSRSVTGSNGLTGGGTLNQNQVISGVNATTGAKGVVQLNDSTGSTSTTTAATANAAKKAYDRAAAYAPSKTGSGASGTWSIAISGTANTVKVNDVGFGTSSTRAIACFGQSSDPTGADYTNIKYPTQKAPTIKGDGTVTIPGELRVQNGWVFESNNELRSGGSNSAMRFFSANGKYNFYDAAGVSFSQLVGGGGNIQPNLLTASEADVKNPENYDEAGEYIGPMTSPIDELKEMVVKLQARVEELEKGGTQKKTTRRKKAE